MPGPPTRDVPSPMVTNSDVAWTVGMGMGLALVAGGATAMAGGWLGGLPWILLGLPAAAAGSWAAIWYALVHRRHWKWADLGFCRARRSLWHLLWQVPVLIVASALATAALVTLFGVHPKGQASGANGLIRTIPLPLALRVGVIVLSVVVIPTAEEVLFRRVLLSWLAQRWGWAVAIPSSAAVFAAVHLSPPIMLYIVFLGMGTGLLWWRYKSLWAPLALHASNNGLVAMALAG